MSLWKIAWRSLRQRSLASTLTGFSMALGVALVVVVLVIHGVISESFQRNAGLGYDIIVGAKGGKLQLVLNTVYHLSTPVENIPYSYLKEFTEGPYKKYVEIAIPYCLGDNYEGFRVVATVPDLFQVEYAPKRKYAFKQGRNFAKAGFFEGVIGATVAAQTKLKLGDTFQPVHGVDENEQGHVHEPFKIVGILEPTGTPNDRALFINIEGFYLLENHAKPVEKTKDAVAKPKSAKAEPHDDHDHDPKHEHEPLPEAQRELTAILIRVSTPTAGIFLPNAVNEGSVAQAVLPVREIRSLFEVIVGPIELILLVLTVLIVVVSGIGILVSIYNSMSERRREIAIMRALGASRTTIRSIVLMESILLSLGGGLAGWLLGHSLIALLSPAIQAQTGVATGLFAFVTAELALVPGLIGLAAAVGYLPAMAAYRTDVARGLAASP